jgi:hypothetical protein
VAGNNVYELAHDTTGKESLDSRHQIKEGNVDDSGEKKGNSVVRATISGEQQKIADSECTEIQSNSEDGMCCEAF